MLIVNADDWGLNTRATDNSLRCLRESRITSVSAMVFMKDSARAATLARDHHLSVGLHVNLTQPFDGPMKSPRVADAQRRVAAFLRTTRWSQLWYNPRLRGDFRAVYGAQHDEYVALYGGQPAHVNGHHHMHLCTNMLLDHVIPSGSRVRPSFSFRPGEKGAFNRLYRRLVNAVLKQRYTCPDRFFGLPARGQAAHLAYVAGLARSHHVELMVHPERSEDLAFLMSAAYRAAMAAVTTGTYEGL
jgi:hypothetical protein